MTTLSVELGTYSSIVGISLHVKDETGRMVCLLPLVNTGLGREAMIALATELQQAMAKGLLVAERAQLVAKNAAADAWGAVMGQRHERIQGIDKALDDREQIVIDYTNHRGERRLRRVLAGPYYKGSTEWHREEQILMPGRDLDTGKYRVFAVSGIHQIYTAKEVGA